MLLRSKPVLCNYYLTYRCNASCSFCDIWERPSPYVNKDNFTQNMRDLKKLGVKVVDLTGGEPLLHREVADLLQIAKDFGMITTITTNTLLYPKKAESLAGKVDMLHFSLDSPDREAHNKSRNVNCFDHFLRSLDIAQSLGERPDILFTVHSGNIGEIEEVYEKFCRPYNYVLILNPIFSYNEVGDELSEADLNALRKWGRKKGVYLNNAFLKLREEGGNQIDRPVCKAGTSTVVISPENKLIMPCYHLEEEALPINNQLYELRKSEKVQSLIKKEGTYKACQSCTVNCYFQPSFSVNMNRFWWSALPSTLKYNLEKGTWKALFKGKKS